MKELRQAIIEFLERNEDAVIIASVATFNDDLTVDEGISWFVGSEAVLRTSYEYLGEGLELELKERDANGLERRTER